VRNPSISLSIIELFFKEGVDINQVVYGKDESILETYLGYVDKVDTLIVKYLIRHGFNLTLLNKQDYYKVINQVDIIDALV
jgi:hypothetical protein